MIELLQEQIKKMVAKPETGMGYQTVSVDYRIKSSQNGTVYNCELLVLEEKPRAQLTEVAFLKMKQLASSSGAYEIRAIRVLGEKEAVTGYLMESASGKPATEGEPKETEDGAIFMRFTAYKNDRRITPNNGLVPGTYATTEADSRHVRTGEEAVERYALPDPTPAKYRYKIEPLIGTKYREGIVQPNFGHAGGGVEDLFDDGTDDNTVILNTILPEK